MSLKLTGAEKSRLRGRGQLLEAALKVGREGASPAVIASLDRLLTAHELVKVRYIGTDRDQRAILTAQLSETTSSTFVGAVGSTALFYRPKVADV